MKAAQFFRALFGSKARETYIEVRAIKKSKRQRLYFTTVDDLCKNMEMIASLNRDGANIFYGVCPRKEKKGNKAAVKEVRVLWADLDPKKISKERALEKLNGLQQKPSITVDSGNGIHAYWLLDIPVVPSNEVEAVLKGMAKALDGDPIVAEVARVMRLPGTLNLKEPSSPKPCTVLSLAPELKYSFEDFVSYKQPVHGKGVSEKTSNINKGPFAEAEKVIAGCYFIRYCRENAVSLEEPLWYAMISNLARCERGRELIHEFSKSFPNYKERETEIKIEHALRDTGPHTCKWIQNAGFNCPTGGCGVTSPLVLGRKERIEDNSMEREQNYTADFPSLIDLGIDREGKLCFIVLKEGGVKAEYEVNLDGESCVPPPVSLLKGLWLPPTIEEVQRWYSEDSDKKLYEDLVIFQKRVSELPIEAHYDLFASWILHTYLLEKFDYSPCLWLFAIPDRGKTRTGKACIYMAHRGIHIESLKEPNLIRYANHYKATLFIDVKDLWKKALKAGSEDILLARYEKGIVVSRVFYPEKGPFRDMVNFEVFGATVIATNEPVDNTLESRAIQINMPESSRNFEENIRAIDLLPFKERLTAFRARHMNTSLPKVSKIAQRRLGDIIRPLHQVLMLVNPEKESVLKDLVREIESDRKAVAADTDEGRILRIIMSQKTKWSGDLLSVKTITESINVGVPDTYKKSSAKVGRILDSMGFKKVRRSDGKYVVCDDRKIDLMKERFGLKTEELDEGKPTQTTQTTQPT